MGAELQEFLALTIVAMVGAGLVATVFWRFFCNFFALPLAQYFLSQGRVKWAMWLKRQS